MSIKSCCHDYSRRCSEYLTCSMSIKSCCHDYSRRCSDQTRCCAKFRSTDASLSGDLFLLRCRWWVVMCLPHVETVRAITSVSHLVQRPGVLWPASHPTLPHSNSHIFSKEKLRCVLPASYTIMMIIIDNLADFCNCVRLSPPQHNTS